jgi:ribosome maturation factor RimP
MNDAIEKIKILTEPLLEGTDIFITNVKIKPTNNVKLYLDADSGMSVEKCISVNRRLRALIESEHLFPEDDFSLEVSSPGVDEPLTMHRQYVKNIGRTVLVTLNDDSAQQGVLRQVTGEEIVLEVKQGKKKEIQAVNLPLADIKTIVVQIVF